MHRTLDQIRTDGIEALRRQLGRAGMVRFLQQFETGAGDYAEERHSWVDGLTMEDLRQLAAKPQRRATRRRARRRPR